MVFFCYFYEFFIYLCFDTIFIWFQFGYIQFGNFYLFKKGDSNQLIKP